MTVEFYKCDHCAFTYASPVALTAGVVHRCPTPKSSKTRTARKVPQ